MMLSYYWKFGLFLYYDEGERCEREEAWFARESWYNGAQVDKTYWYAVTLGLDGVE